MAVDSGVIVNPVTASGQIEGGMTQALGLRRVRRDEVRRQGPRIGTRSGRYHIFRADEMPDLRRSSSRPLSRSIPFGVKAVAEIPMDGVAPAVGNAMLDALGVNMDVIPITPERVWQKIQAQPSG